MIMAVFSLFLHFYYVLAIVLSVIDAVSFEFWRSTWQPTPIFLPGKSHGWRDLVGYRPWGREESDMTE